MAAQLARAGLFAIISYLAQSAFHRGKTLGAVRLALGTEANFHPADNEVKIIPDTINCEDLHVHEGLIFAACQEKDGTRKGWFPALHNFNDPSQAIYGNLRIIDPETDTAIPLKIEGFGNRPFTTHGIDVIADTHNKAAVFIHAVNHAPNSDPEGPAAASRVEIFHHVLGSGTAQWVRTVAVPVITTPNDIFSVSPSEFFVTNDHHYRDGPMRLVEDLGTRQVAAWSTIAHCDADLDYTDDVGVNYKLALEHKLHNNNGLGHGPDGTVIINDAAGGTFYFAKIGEDDQLQLLPGEIQLPSTIDNPFWFADPYPEVSHDASGAVNAGLQHAITMAKTLQEDGDIASVVYLSKGTPGAAAKEWNTTRLFADDGSRLNSASAAVLVAIDPKTNGGKKQAKLYASGFASKGVLSTVVDL